MAREQLDDVRAETLGRRPEGKRPVPLGSPRGNRRGGGPRRGGPPPSAPEREMADDDDDSAGWESFSDEKKEKIKRGLKLQCKMIARLPTAFLPPPLDEEEEEAVIEALYLVGEEYLPYWYQKQGPWAMLAFTLGGVYGPRILIKIEMMKEARARAARDAGTQKTPAGGSLGAGQNIPGHGAGGG